MIVNINNKAHTVAQDITLAQLLDHMGMEQKTGIALAVNHTVIPNTKWEETSVQEQDNILIIAATKGG